MFDTKVIKDVVFVAGQTLSNDVEILRQIVQPVHSQNKVPSTQESVVRQKLTIAW